MFRSIDYDQATKVVRKYSSGWGCAAKPLEHTFFLRLKSILQKTLEKYIYENNIMSVPQCLAN